jgi:hypothetical protein
MKALLAAQAQSSGSDAAASDDPAAPADDSDPVKHDGVPSGSIGVNWTDGTTWTSSIVKLTNLDTEHMTQLDMSVLTHLTGNETSS